MTRARLVLLLLLPGCHLGEEPCAAYRALPEARALCLREEARARPDLRSLEELCAPLREPADCRKSWVEAHLQDSDRETLLSLCGADADCRLTVLDARAEKELQAQLRLCEAHAGELARDCAIHALGRWWRAHPDSQEAARVAAFSGPFSKDIADWLGALASCRGLEGCASWPPLVEACAEAAADLREHPERCPSDRL